MCGTTGLNAVYCILDANHTNISHNTVREARKMERARQQEDAVCIMAGQVFPTPQLPVKKYICNRKQSSVIS
jgi:hypothetical protein